jgi:CheY-like chemotaxis protein
MRHILVVDDDEGIRETLNLLLEDIGYQTSEAQDGIQALEMLRTASPGVIVILDYAMPRLNAMGVLQEVARDANLARHHGYIMITARRDVSDPNLLALCSTLQVPIIAKPFELNELLTAVTEVSQRIPPPHPHS